MNNLIINPQFIGSQQTHHKNYIGWISEEIIVLKIKEREREPSSYCYGPVGPERTTHTSSWRQQGWWRWPPQWFPPPAEYQNRAPDGIASEQRLAAAIKLFRVSLRGFQNIWEFIGQKLGQTEAQGAHKPGWRATPLGPRHLALWGPRASSGCLPKLLGSLIVQKKSSKSFIVFGLL